MEGNGILWLILGLAVIAAIVAAIVIMSRQRKTKQAERARSLRSEADEQSRVVRQRESKAAEVDARARAAQAEADIKAAEAERLSLTADAQKAEASQQRADVDDQFRRADKIDPHHDTNRDQNNTRDHDANREHDTNHSGSSATTSGSGQPPKEGLGTNEDRDRQTPL